MVVGGIGYLHPADCPCGQHDKTPRPCPYPNCDAVLPGNLRLGHHIAFIHRRRKRGFHRVVIPDGTGWLHGALRDPRRMAGLHLDSLPRFAQWLNEQWKTDFGKRGHPNKMRRSRRLQLKEHLNSAREQAEQAPNNSWPLPIAQPVIPAALGEVICGLALESNLPIRYIAAALLCYGTEMLAKELRATNHAPYPRIPTSG